MHRVLVTGLGGAGRTTVAAATALAAAATGRRTLLLSAEADAVLGVPVTGTPARPDRIADGLWAGLVDAGADFRAEFLDLQKRASAGLDLLGAARLEDEELTELPGSEQFALLRALTVASRGDWDVLVLDMPPLRETIALLALPEQLRRYLRRLLPAERQAARALRPMLAQLAGVPMPAQWLYETAERWDSELAGVQSVIESGNTALTLVAEPGPAAADALRTARAGLGLFGHRVGTVVANRCVPEGSEDPFVASLGAQQERCRQEWLSAWTPAASVCLLPHLGRDPRGLDDLARLQKEANCCSFEHHFADDPEGYGLDGLVTALHGDREGPRPGPGRVENVHEEAVRRHEEIASLADTDNIWHGRNGRIPKEPRPGPAADDGTLVWHLDLPGAVKEQLTLVRRGDELLITVGPFRRILPLPSALRRCTVAGAGLRDGTLSVRFTPDPALWPRGR
ncbi:ArsA-related P-loop ATPase [Streptomyces sp. NPDC049597]|uniref:ArsA family ATPase n=1 Tax=Streptomyces sp. NPDC049597 TaxID=3155276 RepID=UPI003415F8A6